MLSFPKVTANMNIVIVCVGSEWYRDDRAGLVVCDNLGQIISRRFGTCNVHIVKCETGLERCLGLIVRCLPDLVIFVDAVQVVEGEEVKPGSVVIVDNVLENESLQDMVSTHKLSIKSVLQLISYLTGREVKGLFVGIIAEKLDLCLEDNCELSEETRRGVERCIDIIRSIVQDLCYRAKPGREYTYPNVESGGIST